MAVVRIGEVFKDAIWQNAAEVIVAHNPPSGDPVLSPEDVRSISQLSVNPPMFRYWK